MQANYDLIVVGGGMAGIAASVAAAKRGTSVLLVEKNNALGGLATSGFIGPMLGFCTSGDQRTHVIEGEFAQLMHRLHLLGGCVDYDSNCTHPIYFQADLLKYAAESYLEEQGVEILTQTTLIGANVVNRRIQSLELYAHGQHFTVGATNFVDASGDGNLLSAAHADFEFGRPGDGRVQAFGIVALFVNVEAGWQRDYDRITQALHEARLLPENKLGIYHDNVVAYETSADALGPCATTVRVGGIRSGGNPLNPEELSRAERQMRATAVRILAICRQASHFFRQASLVFPALPGVRESRRLVGRRRLESQDIVQATAFPDAICRGHYWIDIHCPMGYADDAFLCCAQCATQHPCRQKSEFPQLLPKHLEPPHNSYFTIPYGALLSASLDNLLAAGRCLSASPEALAASRVMSIACATGEAAGTAAALAALSALPPAQLDIAQLQQNLRQGGALL